MLKSTIGRLRCYLSRTLLGRRHVLGRPYESRPLGAVEQWERLGDPARPMVAVHNVGRVKSCKLCGAVREVKARKRNG